MQSVSSNSCVAGSLSMDKMFALFLFFTIGLYAENVFVHSINTKESSPPKHSAEKTGALNIVAYPPQADIYINGKHVGKGATIKQLPVGGYEIYVALEKKSKTMTAYVIPDAVREVTMKLKRRLSLNLTPCFSQFWVRDARAFGPGIKIEIQHEKAFYGINFNWDLFYEKSHNQRGGYEGWGLGGAGFSWRYQVVSLIDIFIVSPGFSIGYWHFSGKKYEGTYGHGEYAYDYENFFESNLFGGPALDLSAGYKKVFFNMGYTLLFGDDIGHIYTIGMRIKI